MEIRIYWIEGNQFIGKAVRPGVLESPRMIRIVPVNRNDISIVFLPLIGDPKEIRIENCSFSWELKDDQLIRAYQQEVTGLTLASSMPNIH